MLFDLLTGLLDSWSLWDDVAGDVETGRRWRRQYLQLTYAAGTYRPYRDLVAEAACAQGLEPTLADVLLARWDELQPWPEAPDVLATIHDRIPVGVVTNCSEVLGQRAAHRPGVPFDVVSSAESAGAYKPAAAPYQRALAQLRLPASRVLFVAGSRFDLGGAHQLGMPVWWHNRVGMARNDQPAPLGEAHSLLPLLEFVTIN